MKCYGASWSGTLTTGSATTNQNIDDGSGNGNTVGAIVGNVLEIWNSDEDTKKAVAVVKSVDSTGSSNDQIDIVPIWVETSGTTALADNDVCYVIGHASEEGSGAPEAFSDELETVWNSAEQFETVVEVSDRLKTAQLRPVDEYQRLKMQNGKAHKMKVENAVLKGARRGSTSSDPTSSPNHIAGADSERITTTAGMIHILENNYDNPSVSRYFNPTMATYTWSDFVDDMINIAHYQEGTTEMYAFCGPQALGFWDKASTTGFLGDGARVNLEPSRQTEFGFKARRLYTNELELNLVRTPALRHATYPYFMVVADPRFVGICKYQSDRYDTHIEDNDEKVQKDRYFSDLGFYMTMIEKHALVEFK